MTGFLNVLFVETPAIPAAKKISSPPANRRLDTLADAAAIAPIASAGIFMVDTNDDVVSRSCFLLVFSSHRIRGVQRVPFSRVSRDHTAEFVCPAFSFSREISPFLPNFFSTHLWNTAKFVIMILAFLQVYLEEFGKRAESTGTCHCAEARRSDRCA